MKSISLDNCHGMVVNTILDLNTMTIYVITKEW